jgi:hypothetical protein
VHARLCVAVQVMCQRRNSTLSCAILVHRQLGYVRWGGGAILLPSAIHGLIARRGSNQTNPTQPSGWDWKRRKRKRRTERRERERERERVGEQVSPNYWWGHKPTSPTMMVGYIALQSPQQQQQRKRYTGLPHLRLSTENLLPPQH